MAAPLEGIRVIEFGQFVAVPSATQQLVELGAEVIKVESPEGDRARTLGPVGVAAYNTYNRGKRSVVLDLKRPENVETALRLVATADVVCQNMSPGTMARLGLGMDRLREVNPGLITVSLAGFPSRGPSARREGMDTAAQAESGMMAQNSATAEDGPLRIGFAVVDQTAAYLVAQAVLAGLLRRVRTGEGGDMEVSLLEAAIHLQTPALIEYAVGGVQPYRRGNGQTFVAPAADVITTADGQFLLSAITQTRFEHLCKLVGKPGLASDPRFVDNSARVAHRAELVEELNRSFGRLTTAEALKLLEGTEVIAAQIRTYPDVIQAADVVDNEVFVPAHCADGSSFLVPRLPYRGAGVDPIAQNRPVPRLGEHTEQIVSALPELPAMGKAETQARAEKYAR